MGEGQHGSSFFTSVSVIFHFFFFCVCVFTFNYIARNFSLVTENIFLESAVSSTVSLRGDKRGHLQVCYGRQGPGPLLPSG